MTARGRRLRFMIAVCTCVFCWTVLKGSDVVAQDEVPEIQSSADYTFGQSMSFGLTAKGVEAVEAVSLFVRAPELDGIYSVELSVKRGDPVEVVQPVDLGRLGLAPFTEVTYWWVLRSTVTGQFTVPKQTLAYNDDRFEWHARSQDDHRVYWTGDDPATGQIALAILIEALPDIKEMIASRDVAPLRLYVYPTSADLRAALRLTGRDLIREHVDPVLGPIFVTAVNARTAAADLQRSIPHEIAHALLFNEVGSAYPDLPLWFNEGLATYVEKMPESTRDALLQEAVEQETTIRFAELCDRFPDTEERTLLAYAQSASLVGFIRDRHGLHEIHELIRAYRGGADCQSGVSQALNVSLDALEESWLNEQEPKTRLMERLSENSLVLLLLAGGFVIARLLLLGPAGEDEGGNTASGSESLSNDNYR